MRAFAILLLIAAACGGPETRWSELALLDGGSGSGAGSGSDTCFECACPAEQTCDPALAGSDCATGCCAPALDALGQPRTDASGAPIYVCATPGCLGDADCEVAGDVCTQGASCAENRCTCPSDAAPDDDDDRDLVCCAVSNVNGVCCSTGELEPDGRCVCPDPRMTDDGWGCACPAGGVTGDDGLCRCEDPAAIYDPYTQACTCPPDLQADRDPYTGELFCESVPIGCGDPYAHVDPETGECACNDGFVEGSTAGGVTAACVPIGCGDGVCSAGESCETCDFDCACGPDPGSDAGVPDSGVPDAGAPDAGIPDAGIPDAVLPDAGILLDATVHDAMIGVDAGSGSGSGIIQF